MFVEKNTNQTLKLSRLFVTLVQIRVYEVSKWQRNSNPKILKHIRRERLDPKENVHSSNCNNNYPRYQ